MKELTADIIFRNNTEINRKGGVPLKKKEYISPELSLISLRLQDIILSSDVENYNGYLDSGSVDWGDNPPPDDGIDW